MNMADKDPRWAEMALEVLSLTNKRLTEVVDAQISHQNELKQIRAEMAAQHRHEKLASEYMDFDDIAALTHRTRNHVKKNIVVSAGFPAACQPPTGHAQTKPHPLYPAKEVRRWLDRNRTFKKSA